MGGEACLPEGQRAGSSGTASRSRSERTELFRTRLFPRRESAWSPDGAKLWWTKSITYVCFSHERSQSAPEGCRRAGRLGARYRRLFETAKDGILILDAATGKIDDVNPFLIDMLGYSYEDFIGRRLWQIGPMKNVKECKSAFLELQTKEYVRYERLAARNGKGWAAR